MYYIYGCVQYNIEEEEICTQQKLFLFAYDLFYIMDDKISSTCQDIISWSCSINNSFYL